MIDFAQFALVPGGLKIARKVNPKGARQPAQHKGGAVPQGKLVSDGGKPVLLDAGSTLIEPEAEAPAATGGGGE
jgi:hypothetical protein